MTIKEAKIELTTKEFLHENAAYAFFKLADHAPNEKYIETFEDIADRHATEAKNIDIALGLVEQIEEYLSKIEDLKEEICYYVQLKID